MASEQYPEQGLEKAKMAWTFRAKFYCAAGNTTLNCTDYGIITLYTKKNVHRSFNFLQGFW